MSATAGQTPDERRRAELWARARRMKALLAGVRYGRAQVAEERRSGGAR